MLKKTESLLPDSIADLTAQDQNQEQNNGASSDYKPYVWFGALLAPTLILCAAIWSLLAPIQGAVIAVGTVVVDGKPKTIQHLDGGIVSEIRVRDGDFVQAGDVLLRLEPDSLNANRDLIIARLEEAKARQARLKTESKGESQISWDQTFPENSITDGIRILINDQTGLFNVRQGGLRGQIEQLNKRIQQSGESIDGMTEQVNFNQKQIDIISSELTTLRKLLSEGYISQTRLLDLERQSAALQGEIASFHAEIARTRTAISETNIEILQVKRSSQEAVLTELRSTESEINDLEEQLISASEQADRVDILSPISGIIHNMNVATIGGVVSPANPIMDIIPEDDELIIEAQLDPASVDQIYIDQPTTIRLSAFNQRTTPELNGWVKNISANTIIDPVTSFPYYTVKVQIPDSELARLGALTLVPGMPAETFIQTDKRTAISYLTKPFSDQLNRTFREE